MILRFIRSNVSLLFLSALLLGNATACALFSDDAGQDPAVTASPIIPTPANTPPPNQPEVQLEVTPGTNIQRLTLWMIPEISPQSDTPSGNLLTEQLAAFDASHPDVELLVEVKSPTGPGSILSYLQNGLTVAPSVMPDLILIPTGQVEEAGNANIIFPLDDLLPTEMQDDLFPVARALGRFEGALVAYPYALTSLHHAAYNSASIDGDLPPNWTALFGTNNSFSFPAAGTNGARLLLQFYLEEGGILEDESSQPMLNADALTAALTQFSLARQNNVLLPASVAITSLEDAWATLISGQAVIAQTSYIQFLTKRTPESNIVFAPLPGPGGPLPPLLNGWSLAVSTPDPARQALAAELLAWLANGPNMGDWSVQSQLLPARSAAFERWPSDPYTTFLQRQVERAEPYPTIADGRINTALSAALISVINGTQPSTAAQQAVESVDQ